MVLCETCGKSFNENAIINHRRTHLSVNEKIKQRRQCKICGALFLSRSGMESHMKNHQSGPQKCDLCDMQLSSRDAVLTHIRLMHRERKYKCTFCDKAFAVNSKLRVCCI